MMIDLRGVTMVLKHRGFLLDVDNFRSQVSPILAALNAGNAQPLFEQALAVIEPAMSGQWPFEVVGEKLLDIRQVDIRGEPRKTLIEDCLRNATVIHASEIGYWLELVLSTFVDRVPDIDIGADYSILDGALAILGWAEEDRQLIFKGVPVSCLFDAATIPIEQTDPGHYWNYARPYNTRSAGWLSREQVCELHHRLLTEQESIHRFDYKRFGNCFVGWVLDTPEGQIEYLQRLLFAYRQAKKMFDVAQQDGRGLYLVLSYE